MAVEDGVTAAAHSPRPTVVLVHGWDDDPAGGWLSWLEIKLTQQDYTVVAPHFKTQPKLNLVRWMEQLHTATVGLPTDSIIVAHSLGCWLSLRLLESWSPQHLIRGLVCVSGFADAPNDRATSYFQPTPDWPHIKSVVERRVCIYSDNDRIVTPDRSRRLAHQLDAELICLPGQGHFLGSRGMDTFPELLELIESF